MTKMSSIKVKLNQGSANDRENRGAEFEKSVLPLSVGGFEKIGLALSGGGFRASFFHLGVLAGMAQLDLLRHIKVISTVSGGSIIGALYYIKLLKRKPQTQQDYINLIKELESDFVDGVRKNIRNKVFFHWLNEFRAVFLNREKLLGNFYDKFFYKDNYKMSDLQSDGMPELIINSTLLSNGRHWYFKTNCMGQYEDEDINFPETKLTYTSESQVYLKDAVTASSCVPGIFNYTKLFLDSTVYKFVDGGAFDNLGVFSLNKEKEKWDLMIISDGSKQLTSQDFIPRNRFRVLRRSYDLSLELNKNLMLKDLESQKICYKHIHLKLKKPTQVHESVGEALSNIRTDLDKFDNEEWKSLAHFGYELSDNELKLIPNASSQPNVAFSFNDISSKMKSPNPFYLAKLKSGSNLGKFGGRMLYHCDDSENEDLKQHWDAIKEIWRKYKIYLVSFLVCFMLFSIEKFAIDHKFLQDPGLKSLITTCIFIFFFIQLFLFSILASDFSVDYSIRNAIKSEDGLEDEFQQMPKILKILIAALFYILIVPLYYFFNWKQESEQKWKRKHIPSLQYYSMTYLGKMLFIKIIHLIILLSIYVMILANVFILISWLITKVIS